VAVAICCYGALFDPEGRRFTGGSPHLLFTSLNYAVGVGLIDWLWAPGLRPSAKLGVGGAPRAARQVTDHGDG